MKGTNLGEFEELVLLTIAALVNDAYSVGICDQLAKWTGRARSWVLCMPSLTGLKKKDW